MARQTLTDRTLKALKAAEKGKRYDVADSVVPGLAVRVTQTGRVTFNLVARYPGSKNPTRRALGEYGAITLDQARDKARNWLEMLKKGVDPSAAEEEQRREAERARLNTFAAVAEDFIADKLPSERKGAEVERDIRREFIPVWGKRPIAEIAARDIREVIRTKKQTAPAQARNLLGVAKRLFAWAADQDCYGLAISPADALKPSKIIGDKPTGQRISRMPSYLRCGGRRAEHRTHMALSTSC